MLDIVFYKNIQRLQNLYINGRGIRIYKQIGNSQHQNDLNLVKYKVMNTLTDNIPYIETCMMTTCARNGKLIVENIDGRTVDIMGREKQQDEGNIQY